MYKSNRRDQARLERSEVNFLWVVRRSEESFRPDDGFDERVKEKGIVVREWVDQREILEHESVKGFVSHCGWNSVLESICAGVPILAWPLAAQQPLNVKFVVEEMKIGMRAETCDGSVKGFVKWEGLKKNVKELMEGVKGRR
ncbi:putative flavonol 3-O-glucosyltransferase [Helianthus debilis subsp. tardiflorus]